MKIIKTVSSFLLILFLCSCQQEEQKETNSFTVSGTLKGLDTEYMIADFNDENGKRINDSIPVKNGNFSYTTKIVQPMHVRIWPQVERTIKKTQGGGYIPAKSSQFAFLASPGDQIVFKGEVTDFIDAYPSGSNANDDLAKINSKVFPLVNESTNILLRKIKLEDDSLKAKILEDSISTINDEIIRLKKEFVNTHPNAEAAAWYLSDMMVRSSVTNEEAIKIFENMNSNLKNYPYYQMVSTRIEGIKSSAVGHTFPDFSTDKTMNGETFQFSSLSGKYVLIDFWGTWCGPCVAEMPKVKEYQDKYKDQLTVLGINSGDTKEKIEKFITPKDYNWKQLLAGKGEDNLVLKFNVAGFPTKFIIDPKGKILNRFVGNGEEAFDVLDELLEL